MIEQLGMSKPEPVIHEAKKKFSPNAHSLSNGFNNLNVPGSVAAAEQFTKLMKNGNEMARTFHDSDRNPEPAGTRMPKPFKKT